MKLSQVKHAIHSPKVEGKLKQNYFFSSCTHIFRQIYFKIFQFSCLLFKYRSIISKLAARPYHQLSADLYSHKFDDKFAYTMPQGLSKILCRYTKIFLNGSNNCIFLSTLKITGGQNLQTVFKPHN